MMRKLKEWYYFIKWMFRNKLKYMISLMVIPVTIFGLWYNAMLFILSVVVLIIAAIVIGAISWIIKICIYDPFKEGYNKYKQEKMDIMDILSKN